MLNYTAFLLQEFTNWNFIYCCYIDKYDIIFLVLGV